jgi:hypothetical protein
MFKIYTHCIVQVVFNECAKCRKEFEQHALYVSVAEYAAEKLEYRNNRQSHSHVAIFAVT